MNGHNIIPSESGRLVQVDARKRITLPEMPSGAMYFLRGDGADGLVLEPAELVKPTARHARYLQEISEDLGRFVKLDSRRRLTVTLARSRGLYLVHVYEGGIIHLVPAVALPRAEYNRMRANFKNRVAVA